MNFIFHSFLLAVVFVDRTICLPKCRVPKVIFVLVDGCRWNYIENEDLPGFQKLAKRGSHASYVTPIFPSNSYPNWYSLVTGLYAENHGFVQNMMYDSKFDDFFLMAPSKTAEVPHWWNDAEPIWITAEKNGRKSALYWWDGCNVEIKGRKPTICRKYQVFTDSINADTKETFMTALNLLSKEEIQLVQLYYEPVDYYGSYEQIFKE